MAPKGTHIKIPPKSYRRLLKHKDTLKKLSTTTRKDRRNQLLAQAKPGLVRCICACAKNILKRTIPVTNEQLVKLKKNRDGVRYLAKSRIPIHKKEKYLNQQGGGLLPLILGPAIKALAGLVF